MFKYIALLTLLVFTSAYTEENGVLILTQADFPQVLTDYPYLFVKFYTPWCGHCKKLAPIFIELAQALSVSHPQIKLADIDLQTHKGISQKYKVNSYPTLIFFKNGKQIRFGGARNLEFMQFWLGKKVLAPLHTINSDKISNLQSDGRVNVVFYGDLSSPKAQILSKISSTDDYNMYYHVADSGKQKDSVEIFRPFAKSVQNNIIDGNIKNWIALFDRPLVYPFDDRSSSQIFSDKRNALFLFDPEGEVGQAVRTALTLVAVDWKINFKRRLIFTEVRATTEEYSSLSDYFKLNPRRHFLVFVKTAEKLKYLFNAKSQEVTKQKIAEFLKNVEGGKIKPFKLDQETRPASEQKKTEQL